MREVLEKKLASHTASYTQEELDWLLAHLDHPSAELRDGLVYNSFGRAISEGLLTQDQFLYLVNWCQSSQPLSFQLDQVGEATLFRSFGALLQSLLVWGDAQSDLPYFGAMTDEARHFFFESALTYLQHETDDTALSESYGWVHAFAHGGDLLAVCASHPAFPQANYQRLLEVISYIFKHRTRRFMGDEELRLAPAIYQAILNHNLSLEDFIAWLDQLDLPLETELDWDRRLSFRLFILTIYVALDQADILDRQTKENLYRWVQVG